MSKAIAVFSSCVPEGWYARILQHEIDHLNGVLYIDRMNPRSFATQDNHLRIWKEKSIAEVKEALSFRADERSKQDPHPTLILTNPIHPS